MTSPVDDDPTERGDDRLMRADAPSPPPPPEESRFTEDEPAAGGAFVSGQFSENQPVPEDELPIRRRKHIETFQNLSFTVIAVLLGLVVLAALLTSIIRPESGPVASEIAKIAIPALIALLGTAITWAFKSG